MKKIYLSILASMFIAMSFATTHTVTNSGLTFTPDSLYITVGDTVDWNVGASHPVLEVDFNEYDNNLNSGNGGFDIPTGVGSESATFTAVGTYYYICTNHIAGGMKGKIVVAAPTFPPSTGTPIITMLSDGDCSGGNPKVVEIYADGYVNFSEFDIEIQTNGNLTWGNNLDLTSLGAVTNEFVYIYKETTAGFFATEFPSAVNTLLTTSSGINFNGDDRIRLVNNTSFAVIDQFGVDGVDGTGETWEYKDGYGYRNTGTGPDGTFVEANWTIVNGGINGLGTCQGGATFESVIGAGSYMSNVTPEISFKTDSFEFNEGDGVVQLDSLLLNPALLAPTTESFEVHLSTSSSATIADFDITGLPIPIVLPQTVSLALLNFTAQALEITLVDDALVEGNEWVQIVLRNAVGINIGADSVLYLKIIDNDFPADTFVSLASNAITVAEDAGSFNIEVDYLQTSTNTAHTVDLQLVSGDMADVDNFATMTATFNALTESFAVNITDDMLVEGNEILTFALFNATNGLRIGSDSIFTLTIEDNDVPTYALGLVDGNDASGADSLNLHGLFKGVVNSLDRGFNSIEFSIQDATGSVDVFSGSAPFSTMLVAIGDEVEIEGDIQFFAGMVRIESLISLTILNSGNVLTPVVVTEINDANESDLVRINGLTLVDPAEWVASGGAGFDVHATDASGDTVVIRIDRDYLDLYNSTAPNSSLIDIVGVASQYDDASPYDANHQIIPRDINDIILYPTLNMDEQGTLVNEGAGTATVNFTVANDNGGSYTVDIELTGGTGTADDIDNFTTQTAVAVTGGVGSITVNITDDTDIEGNESLEFTLSNPSAGLLLGNGKTFELTITDNDADAISEINVNALTVYPNPAAEKVILKMISNEKQIANITLIDVVGKLIQSNTFMLNNGTNAIELDLTKVATGNYMINISTENGNHTENLLVR